MYVRKFEADTLDEALKNIKKELGPDAIILKTVTNKGLKGAFKKKKIEITAAITESNYSDKMRVDKVLNEEQKDKFYQNSSSMIANMIDQYSGRDLKNESPKLSSYGNLGKNLPVKQVKETTSLDDFLKEEKVEIPKMIEPEEVYDKNVTFDQIHLEDKIEKLERSLFEMEKRFEKSVKKSPEGITYLRSLLSSVQVSERIIQKIVKKCIFELNESDLENSDIVFELALREMLNTISVSMPLFSKVESSNSPSVTVFLSEDSCGQSSIAQKIVSMKENSMIIRCNSSDEQNSFTDKIFKIDIVKASGISEVISEVRKGIEKKKNIFIDYKVEKISIDETKKFFNGMKRGFDNLEFFVSLSSIHSEEYNRRILNTYKNMIDGIVLSHLDLCLNYGALYNLAFDFYQVPFIFFSTGKVIPDDIEAATPERIVGGIFDLKTNRD